MSILRAVMIGDVVGDPGLEALEERLPGLIQETGAALVTVNGENAAGGFGMTGETLKRILNAGADVVTSGNHVWEKRDFWQVMNTDSRILRPANYPAGVPGRGWITIGKNVEGDFVSWLVINLQGRELMKPIDCPFRTFDEIANSRNGIASDTHPLFDLEGLLPNLESGSSDIIVVDFHAESSQEKEALAFYLDGRAGIVAGTHTHVQTADERILPKGTAYITDLGMTGVKNSILGMDTTICLNRAKTQLSSRMECAKGEAAIQGIIVEIDRQTGKAVSIRRIRG
ncbi:MAG: YmdB family metallophosphoesterase [Treponema sp.]|jgi:calcineurin-like phosphoesterase|nr:YmdB family metallophosphoesterase [Treponema sp.]